MAVTIKGSGQVVVQVVSVPVTNAFTSSSTSMTDITGFTASITPTNSSNKIMVIISMTTSRSGNGYGNAFQCLRNGTPVGVGTLGTTAPNYSFGTNMATNANIYNQSFHFVDSPSTTSTLTYKLQVRVESGGGTLSLNNNTSYLNGGTEVYQAAYASQITLMEIAYA
jgi:hypothetical protein